MATSLYSVLVVEDERIVAKDLQQTLQGLGYDAFAIASSAEEAIACASERCPDVVLMDIRIKGALDGIATADILRTRFEVPIIYLTAHADLGTIDRAKYTEPQGYLLKPVKSAELRSAIEVARHRHILEKRLRASEAQLRLAQEIACIGSWELDVATNRVMRSEQLCRIMGLSEKDAGTDAAAQFERIHPEDRERVRTELQRAGRTGESWASDYRIVREDGVRFIRARAEVVRDRTGSPVRMLGTAQDLTEQKQLEARIVVSDRMASVGTMAAGVAHEINNPLAYVMANLDLIAEEIRTLSGRSPSSNMKELEEMINEARHGAERVRKIVRGMKTLSRADEERRVPLDVRVVLELSINMAFNEIRHRARVVKDYGELPLVLADEAQLGQVFINLLVNAAHAIPEGHVEKNEIRVITKMDASGRAIIEVRDTGRGIPSDIVTRIFDPFFTTKSIGEGTGLGLSICHGIVKGLGGEIFAESGPGNGSTFRIVLPAANLERHEPQKELVASRPPVGRRGQVLIVDDDPLVGTSLRRVLGKEHEVTVVTDGRQALDLLLAGKWFDVILCDLMMPNVTGMELYAELSCALPEIVDRMVFITGGAFTSAAREFLDTVPNQRLEKPFAPQNMRALVRGLVR